MQFEDQRLNDEIKFAKIFRQYESATIRRSAFYGKNADSLSKATNQACKGKNSYVPNLTFDNASKEVLLKAGFGRLLELGKDRTPPISEYSGRACDYHDATKVPYITRISNSRLFQLSQAAISSLKVLKLDKANLLALSLDDAVQNLHGNSSGGFNYWVKKSKCWKTILADAKELYNKRDFRWLKFPMTTGFRVQQRPEHYGIPECQIKVKSRMFLVYSGLITLFEEKFHGISTYLAQVETPYFTGKTGRIYGKQLRSIFSNEKRIIGSDLSGFDKSIKTDLIIAGFVMIRMAFAELSAKDEYLLMQLCTYFCVSTVHVNHPKFGNLTFNKHSGVPSGSVFTNLIDTLVHVIVLNMNYPTIINDGKFAVCGDDILMSIPKSFKVSDLRLAYSKEGLTMKEEVSFIFHPNKMLFLGHWWLDYQKHIHVKLALNNILWHSEFEKTLSVHDRIVARTVSILANGKNGYIIFNKIFPELIKIAKMDKSFQVKYFVNKLGFFIPNGSSLSEERIRSANLLKLIKFGYLDA